MAFFAHREDIQRNVDQGMSLIAIYEMLGPKLGITYSQFTRHVSNFIAKPQRFAARPSASSFPDSPNQNPPTSPTPDAALTTPRETPRAAFVKGERSPDRSQLI
jgi:hypothetical protein